MACSSACKTQDHKTYGECLKAKAVRPVGLSIDPSFATSRQKAWDKELDLYESAVRQGIQPETTQTKDIRQALDASDQFGKPYRADVL